MQKDEHYNIDCCTFVFLGQPSYGFKQLNFPKDWKLNNSLKVVVTPCNDRKSSAYVCHSLKVEGTS